MGEQPDWNGLQLQLERLVQAIERHAPTLRSKPEGDVATWRWTTRQGFVPIQRPRLTDPSDLLFIDRQSRTLAANTAQFLAGKPANHALLWGARGTGKSSLIRSLPLRFADPAPVLIEIDALELHHLPDLLDGLSGDQRRFILFADDLSFDASNPSYTALKALLDGSLAATPDNVLIYATSNRRHLMPEASADNLQAHIENGELHPGEAVEEKISLSERFGVWLAFHPFTQEQYLACVRHWLARLGAEGQPAELEAEALRWALRRGARNGRVAYQFAISALSPSAT